MYAASKVPAVTQLHETRLKSPLSLLSSQVRLDLFRDLQSAAEVQMQAEIIPALILSEFFEG